MTPKTRTEIIIVLVILGAGIAAVSIMSYVNQRDKPMLSDQLYDKGESLTHRALGYQIVYGQEIIPIKQKHKSETKDDNDKPKTLEEQKADLDPDKINILMNYTDGKQEWISLPNPCIDYKSEFYDVHAEVQIINIVMQLAR